MFNVVKSFIFIWLLILGYGSVCSQSYIDYATYLGGNDEELFPSIHTDSKNNIHVYYQTYSNNIPTTDGSVYNNATNFNYIYAKYNSLGELVFQKYVEHDQRIGRAFGNQTKLSPTDELHVLTKINFSSDIYYTHFDTLGNVVFDTVVGNFSASGGTDFLGGFSSSNIAFSNQGDVHIVFGAGIGFPVVGGGTPFNPINSFSTDVYYQKYDKDHNLVFATYHGGGSIDFYPYIKVLSNGNAVISGYTYSNDFPVTDNSQFQGFTSNFISIFQGPTVLFSTMLGEVEEYNFFGNSMEIDVFDNIHIVDNIYNNNYIQKNSTVTIPGSSDIAYTKIDKNGEILFSTFFGGSSDDYYTDLKVNKRGDAYIIGSTYSTNLPNSNNMYKGNGDYFITKFNKNTINDFSSYLGGSQYETELLVAYINGQMPNLQIDSKNNLHIVGITESNNDFPITNGSFISQSAAETYTALNENGKIFYSTFIGGLTDGFYDQISQSVNNDGNAIHLIDYTYVNSLSLHDYVTIDGEIRKGQEDVHLTKIVHCDTNFLIPAIDTLSPAIQTLCKDEKVNIIKGLDVIIPSDSMPKYNYLGAQLKQQKIDANYQWQLSFDSINWNTINMPSKRDYQPPSITSGTRYFRRISTMNKNCGFEVLSISSVVKITQDLTPPTADAGLDSTICNGNTTSIGGNPSATGVGPFTYTWDQGVGNGLQQLVSPTEIIKYELTVTDNATGCSVADEVIISVYNANAGVDLSVCEGESIKIKSIPVPGLAGSTYQWSPTTNLNDPNIAQPLLTPTTSQTYQLSFTYPATNGSTCISIDSMDVTLVNSPNANFAGEDTINIFGTNTNLITTSPQGGYTYTWVPGIYLNSNLGLTGKIFNAGNLTFPTIQDPMRYLVTASTSNCSFVDSINVSVIHADAGLDNCGPRSIGGNTDAPGLNETFLWEKLSGSAQILGDINTPITTVSSSTTDTSYFKLTVTLGSLSTSDIVAVLPDCINNEASVNGSGHSGSFPGVCNVKISTASEVGCPLAIFSPITLIADSLTHNSSDYIYSWTPTEGINSSNIQNVVLTDTINRTYTVTIQHKLDTNYTCLDSIEVNQPNIELPVFPIDSVKFACPNESVQIGNPLIFDYSYEWSPIIGLDVSNTNNPISTAENTQDYIVKVTDTLIGCYIFDTAKVYRFDVIDIELDPDFSVCDSAIVTLNVNIVDSLLNYTWSSSQSIDFQGSDDSNTFEPTVLVTAPGQTFVLSVFDPIVGCTVEDSITITVQNLSVPDFGNVTLCKPTDIDVQIGGEVPNSISYSWSPSIGLNDTTIASPLASPNITTNYTVTVTFLGNCPPSTDLVTVNVIDPEIKTYIIDFCPDGGPVNLFDSIPTGKNPYSWEPEILVNNPAIYNATTLNPPPSNPTLFTVNMFENGCPFSNSVLINPESSAPIVIGNTSICEGTDIFIGSDLNPTLNHQYAWSATNSGTVYLDDINSRNPLFSGAPSGIYEFTLEKTDLLLSCTTEETIRIIVSPPSFSFPTDTVIRICSFSNVLIGVEPVPGVEYFWSPASLVASPNSATTLAFPPSDTVFHLLGVDQNGCEDNFELTVVVETQFQSPTISLPDTIIVPISAYYQILNPIVDTNGVYDYVWTPDNIFINNQFIKNPTISISEIGVTEYTVLVSTNENCFSQASTFLKIVPELIDLSLIFSVDNPTPIIGDQVIFTVNVHNNGPANATGVAVEAFLPAGYILDTASNGGIVQNNLVTWSNLLIPVGANTQFTIKAAVQNPLEVANEYLAYAQVIAHDQDDVDSELNNYLYPLNPIEDDEDTTLVVISKNPLPVTEADLELDLSVNNTMPNVGDTLLFTVVVNNNGPDNATGVAAEAVFSVGYDIVGIIGNTVLWSDFTLNVGGDTTFTIQAIVNTPIDSLGEYFVYSQVTASDQSDPDSQPNNFVNTPSEDDESALFTSPLGTEGLIDLELVKTVSNNEPDVGTSIVFTIEVVNKGPLDATGVQISDQLTAGFAYNDDDSDGDYDPITSIWNIGDLPSGTSKILNITATVLFDEDESLFFNQAEVISADQTDFDSEPGNCSDSNLEDDCSIVSVIPNSILIIPEGFSPNGDVFNETFEIINLAFFFPNFKLEIFNRYGLMLNTYTHNGDPLSKPLWWDGKYMKSKEIAPTGTYFYILYFNDGTEGVTTGWLYLNK